MLPGFRFLSVAIVLAMSIMIFGLGAASLLRSAHQEFASLPTRRAPPETIFTQSPDDPPRLALLSIDARKPYNQLPVQEAAAPVAPALTESPQPTALIPVDKPSESQAIAAPATPDIATTSPEPLPVAETRAVPAPTDTVAPAPMPPAVPQETSIATERLALASQTNPSQATPSQTTLSQTTPSPPVETTASINPPIAKTPDTSDANALSSRIAVLGGPPVEISPVAATKPAAITRPRATRRRVIRRKISAPAPPPAVDAVRPGLTMPAR